MVASSGNRTFLAWKAYHTGSATKDPQVTHSPTALSYWGCIEPLRANHWALGSLIQLCGASLAAEGEGTAPGLGVTEYISCLIFWLPNQALGDVQPHGSQFTAHVAVQTRLGDFI